MIAFVTGALPTVKRRPLAFVVSVLCLSLSGLALAQPGGKDEARRFFNAGQKAFAAGRYVEAAKAFEEAFRVKPHPAPLINAGDAWEKAGEVALAARSFQRVMKLEQSGEQDRSDATERLARLTPKLGIIELDGDSSVRARVDDDEFRGGDRVYVVPGAHSVTLVDVDESKERKLDIAAGTSRTVRLKALMPSADEEQEDKPAAKPPVEDTPPPEPAATKGGSVRAPTVVVFVLTAAAAGGAVYFGLQVNDAEKKYNDSPNRDDLDRFNKNKLYTNICIGAAVVGAGVGTFLLIKDLGKKQPAAPPADSAKLRLGFDAAPAPGGAVLFGSGRF